MKRAIWLIIAAVLVFAGIVAARLPASWVLPDAKSGIACAEIDGTIWSGTCSGLTAQQQSIGDLSWEVHASRLLAGKLNAAVALTRPSGMSHGTIEVGLDRKITARDIQADLPVDPQLFQNLPPSLHGNIHAEIALLRVEGRTIKALQGRIDARDIVDGVGNAAQSLGSYSFTFPPAGGGEPVGQLRDLGGPLAVEGSLRLTAEPGWELKCLVKARPTASPDLVQAIQFLSSPDAEGRRDCGTQGNY